MAVLKLTEEVSVAVEKGREKRFAYSLISGEEKLLQYETSADIRKPAGILGVRNVVFRHTNLEKPEIERRLKEELSRHEGSLNDSETEQ
ncbi:hypothetical protein ACNS7O_15025 (plasmid) [Haloferacaceae archaeon DSL9]